jgi:hypothetical protein
MHKGKYTMLTLITKAPAIPLVQASRLTCIGMQYTVVGSGYDYVVTASGEQLICTCGEPACVHIQAVQAQQARNTAANTRRDAYTALFDLGYLE